MSTGSAVVAPKRPTGPAGNVAHHEIAVDAMMIDGARALRDGTLVGPDSGTVDREADPGDERDPGRARGGMMICGEMRTLSGRRSQSQRGMRTQRERRASRERKPHAGTPLERKRTQRGKRGENVLDPVIVTIILSATMLRGVNAVALVSGQTDGIEPSRVNETLENAAGTAGIARARARATGVTEAVRGPDAKLVALAMSVQHLTGTSHEHEKEAARELTTESESETVNGTATATATERRIDSGTRADIETGTAMRTAIAIATGTGIGIGTGHESATDEIALRLETAPPAHVSATRKTWRSESRQLSSSARRKPRNTSLSRRKPGRKAFLFQASVTAHPLTSLSRMTVTVHALTRIDTYLVYATIESDDEPADLAVATVIETVTEIVNEREKGTGTGTGTETGTEKEIGIGPVSGIGTGSVSEIARGTVRETGMTGLATDTGTVIMNGTATVTATARETDVVRGAFPHAANDATAVAAVGEAAVVEGGVAARHTHTRDKARRLGFFS
jgi:hypothetical protein